MVTASGSIVRIQTNSNTQFRTTLGQFVDAINADDEFHAQIAMISNLPRLWRTIEISKAPIDRCRYIMLPRVGQAEATLEQHREIIRALNSRDPEKAAAAMRSHLDSAYRSAAAVLDAANVLDAPFLA